MEAVLLVLLALIPSQSAVSPSPARLVRPFRLSNPFHLLILCTLPVEIATKVSSSFVSDTANDGLVGLAFSSINTVSPTAQKTFYDNAKSSLSKGVFTADLKYHAAGTYDFGVIDSSKYTGSITYVDVDSSQGFWGFTGTGYAVGSGSFKSSSIDTIADTGTTLIYAPDAVVKAYYAQVSGSSL